MSIRTDRRLKEHGNKLAELRERLGDLEALVSTNVELQEEVASLRERNVSLERRNGALTQEARSLREQLQETRLDKAAANRRAERSGCLAFWALLFAGIMLVAAAFYGVFNDTADTADIKQRSTAVPPSATKFVIEGDKVTVYEDGMPVLSVESQRGSSRGECMKWLHDGGLNAPVAHYAWSERLDAALKICGKPQG